ncbi:MAG: hypothetical protein ABH879_10220 [archaeon]
MKKALLVLLLVLTACGKLPIGPGSGPDRDAPSQIARDFHKGTQGLALSFLPDLPPDETFLGPIEMALKVENLGAYTIHEIDKPIQVKIDNPYSAYISLDKDLIKLDSLEGKGVSAPEGMFEVIEYTAMAGTIPHEKEYPFLFKAKACYIYETHASADLCIDTSVRDPMNLIKKNCQAENVALSDQGAPIAVKRIEERVVPLGEDYIMELTVYIENAGGGAVTAPQSYDLDCRGGIAVNRLVDIESEISLGGIKVDNCLAPIEDPKNGKLVSIFCTRALGPEKRSYTTPISVGLRYGYISAPVVKSVKVKKPEGTAAQSCPKENCKSKSEYGGDCSIFGGEDKTRLCSDPSMKCCKYGVPDCEKDASYLCVAAGSDCVDPRVGLCPGNMKCCKKTAANCNTVCKNDESQCKTGYGGVDPSKKCSGNQVCCRYAAAPACGLPETLTEGYACTTDTAGKICTSFLCTGGSDNVCCKEKQKT